MSAKTASSTPLSITICFQEPLSISFSVSLSLALSGGKRESRTKLRLGLIPPGDYSANVNTAAKHELCEY